MIRNRNAKFFNEEYSRYDIDNNIDAYQFFKYHCLGYNTPPNYGAMFFGITPFSLNQSKSIMEQFSNKGFITATAVNSCAREAYNIFFTMLIFILRIMRVLLYFATHIFLFQKIDIRYMPE